MYFSPKRQNSPVMGIPEEPSPTKHNINVMNHDPIVGAATGLTQSICNQYVVHVPCSREQSI